MAFEKTFIPYRGYYSSPFCRWQGSLAGAHSIELAARVASKALAARKIDPRSLDAVVLGVTIPQHKSFYGAPWLAAMIGAEGVGGPTVSQACATSARVLATAAAEVELGQRGCVLAIGCDRTSNGPHVYFPEPAGPGGRGRSEDPVIDNFERDPWAKLQMVETAENVAREHGISRGQQDEMTALRYAQYARGLEDGRAFQRRYMEAVELPRGKKEPLVVETDEGIHPTTAESLAKLRPVVDGGTVTFGAQTHPADGNAAVIVCNADSARRLSADPKITVRLVAYGDARVKKGFMPTAPVPAARAALERAGIGIDACKVITTHNPFAVNDVYFCREMKVPAERMNPYGSPLVYGHPQAPTGLRAIMELVEALVLAGGGYGLFTGCAAGDTATSVVVRVD